MQRFLFFLTASPYGGQTAASALRLAQAALDLGHGVSIFATGDGVHGFVKGQAPKGVFDAGGAAGAILARGGTVDL
jgi:sulfur relay (sulfurtransferase) complex TusBCD TusD component (DsrE family)